MEIQALPTIQAYASEYERLYPARSFRPGDWRTSLFLRNPGKWSGTAPWNMYRLSSTGAPLPGQQAETARQALKQRFTETLSLLITMLRTKDPQLYLHSLRVQHLTHLFTRTLSLTQGERTRIELAALFHDIGKLNVANDVLLKPGALTAQEFEHVKEHCLQGALLLSQAGVLEDVALQVYHHHERWDGGGYPTGLAGAAIPFGARIVAIADAFEVMTTRCTYQSPRAPAQAVEELYRCAGTQFDPELVDLFCSALAAPAYIAPHRTRGGYHLAVIEEIPPLLPDRSA